jgi:hypothetical protein
MKRFTLVMSITVAVLLLTTEFVTAQRGQGRSGNPAGPPATSQRGQMPDRSGKPAKEPRGPESVDREQMHSKLTVSDHLAKNTQLAARLQGMLPPGTDLTQASAGFKNFGQFVAAVQVSKNLGIPFDQLKAKMTGDSSVSLGKAIQELRPEVDAKSEAKKAEQQAKEEIRQAEAARKNETRQANQSGKKE